ncbi:MAG TPA: protein kinase, partial [Thermoanaerobaculia bacterium]|nr:protein kinase [Thermoanaerobaculia bacterium]
MNMAAGTRLGPYEIVSRIGAGGMGEVWQARDTRLDRSVAVKILPAEFANDAQLRLRFEREAKTISQLNHPNICSLFDVGENYLVMELLEGESLSDRIAKGPLPLADVLKYGAQIADALDRAHRSGVTHRDLKPANVMVTRSGAKLLDFGLAKGPVLDVSVDEATHQRALTQEGTILGTFQYMAPEQLEGVQVDARSDIFAFGALLYEMVSGKRAFDGKTKTSLIAAIVGTTPRPLNELQPLTPAALEHVIARCLEKAPEDRWQNAHDVAEELRWIGGSSARASAVPVARSKKTAIASGVLIAVIAALAGAAAMWFVARRNAAKPRTLRTSIVLPADSPLAVYGSNRISISPNGNLVAYVALRSGVQQVYVRRLDRFDAIPLAGSEGATAPFFSPDSEWVGFSDGKHLKRAAIDGGSPQMIADVVDVRWATWMSDGTIVFARGTEGLFAVPADGGLPVPVAQGSGRFGLAPEAIPDSNLLVGIQGTGAIVIVDKTTGKSKKVYESADLISGAKVVAGYLVFCRAGSLLAAPFDTKRLATTGAAKMIAESVLVTQPFATPLFAVSQNGTLVYVAGTPGFGMSTLSWIDRKGDALPVNAKARAFEDPRVSPDGRIAVTLREANPDVWLEDASRDVLTRFTFGAEEDETPDWSPDGKWIAYSALRGNTHHIYVKSADGSGEEKVLTTAANHGHTGSWAPDGSSIVFTDYSASTRGDIWFKPLAPAGPPRPILQTPFNERAPRISRDGHWMAYMSDESGRDEVYVQSYPRPGAKFQVSIDGGGEPVWSPSGHELFYRHGDAMMSVKVTFTPTFSATTPELLFHADF